MGGKHFPDVERGIVIRAVEAVRVKGGFAVDGRDPVGIQNIGQCRAEPDHTVLRVCGMVPGGSGIDIPLGAVCVQDQPKRRVLSVDRLEIGKGADR